MTQLIHTKNHYFLLFLLLIILFLFGAAFFGSFNKQAFASVMVDSQKSVNLDHAGKTSWQHTTANNPDRLLIVSIRSKGKVPSSVKYNSVNLAMFQSVKTNATPPDTGA